MKKGKITLGIVLGLLTIGFVVALAQGVFAGGSDSASDTAPLGATGVICLDQTSYCNDAKLVYQNLGGGFFALNGYEYGCGHDDRIIDGTMRKEGNTLYIAYTTISGTSTTTPFIGQVYAEVDLGTKTGNGLWAWHYGGYHHGTTPVKIVPCPVSAVEVGEPDSAQ